MKRKEASAEADLFCICRGPDDGSLMIECNYCSEWFHTSCLNMSPQDLESLSEYKCQACVNKKDDDHVVEKIPVSNGRAAKKSKTVEQKDSGRESLRRTVREKLESALKPLLPDAEPDLYARIEDSLFRAFVGNSKTPGPAISLSLYKSKYMSLLFNLKDPKNRRLREELTNGSLSTDRLVQLSPAEMANEDLSQMIRSVREASVSQAVLEDVEGGFVKKTHKGEEMMSGLPSPKVTITEPFLPYHPQSHEDDEEEAETVYAWEGLVLLQDYANFEVKIDLNIIPDHLTRHLPANFHVAGRIDPAKAQSYLESIIDCPTREIVAFRVTPRDQQLALVGSNGHPCKLIDYLVGSNRWAVIAVDVKRTLLRDLYLIPWVELDKYQSRLTNLIDRSIFDMESKQDDPNGFLAILVLSKR